MTARAKAKAPKSERRIKKVAAPPPAAIQEPTPTEPKPSPREQLEEVAGWVSDHLYLSAIESVNDLHYIVLELTDRAVKNGTMGTSAHDHYAMRAGGAAQEAISTLLTMRQGESDVSGLLYTISRELPSEAEATK